MFRVLSTKRERSESLCRTWNFLPMHQMISFFLCWNNIYFETTWLVFERFFRAEQELVLWTNSGLYLNLNTQRSSKYELEQEHKHWHHLIQISDWMYLKVWARVQSGCSRLLVCTKTEWWSLWNLARCLRTLQHIHFTHQLGLKLDVASLEIFMLLFFIL